MFFLHYESKIGCKFTAFLLNSFSVIGYIFVPFVDKNMK